MFTVLREEQFANASVPILVTLIGIVIEVRAVHPSNALFPILMILLGITIEVRA